MKTQITIDCELTSNLGVIGGQVLSVRNVDYERKGTTERVKQAEMRVGAGAGIGPVRVSGETGSFDKLVVGDTVIAVYHLEPGWRKEDGPQMVVEEVQKLGKVVKAGYSFSGDGLTPSPAATPHK